MAKKYFDDDDGSGVTVAVLAIFPISSTAASAQALPPRAHWLDRERSAHADRKMLFSRFQQLDNGLIARGESNCSYRSPAVTRLG